MAISQVEFHELQCKTNGFAKASDTESHEFHSKTNGLERVSQVESHEFQYKSNGVLKVFHTESHEFHSKTNGIAQLLFWNLMNPIVKPIIELRLLMLNLINSNEEPTCFRHLQNETHEFQ